MEEVEEGLPEVYGDRKRVRQVLLNLVSNAVKFTEAGRIEVWAWSGDGEVTVTVRDTGVGIREGDMLKLFQEFERIESGITQRYGGTGLGLAISRRLVEMMGGRIWVESEYGVGSTFYFTLPVSKDDGGEGEEVA